MTDEPLPNPVRWNLKHSMILIGLLAVGFSTVGIAGTVLVGIITSPAWLARRGEKLSRLYWILACYPLVPLVGLYVIWITGSNHATGTFLDSFMGELVRLVPATLGSSLILTILGVLFSRTSSPGYWFARLILVLVIDLSVFVLIRSDPFGALDWYFG